MGESTNVALAYCAGLIDGEGCIFITRHRRKKYLHEHGFGLMVSLNIIELKPIEFLVGVLGGNRYIYINKKYNYYMNSWNMYGRAAADALKKIRKYLIVKKDQADVAIEFQNHLDRTKALTFTKHPELYEYRTNLYNKMKALKRIRAGVEHNSSENESLSDVPNLKEISVT